MVAHARTDKDGEPADGVVAGLRRNGFSHYRCNYNTGKLEKSENQSWCKDILTGEVLLPEGSRRQEPSWLNDRDLCLDSDGKPMGADWTTCTKAQILLHFS